MKEENSNPEGTEMRRVSENDCSTIKSCSISKIRVVENIRAQVEELLQQIRTISVRSRWQWKSKECSVRSMCTMMKVMYIAKTEA